MFQIDLDYCQSTFESPDDLIAESKFRIVAIIDFRCLAMMATIEIFGLQSTCKGPVKLI